MNERKLKYLETLRATGNPSRARAAAGVVRKTVSLWERDEQFAEAAEEAQSAANDAILERAREQAMAGDSGLLAVWMRALVPTLRPASSVQVGVQVNGASRAGQLTDEELIERGRRVLADIDMRRALPAARTPGSDVIDVEPLPRMAESDPASEPDEIDPEDLV